MNPILLALVTVVMAWLALLAAVARSPRASPVWTGLSVMTLTLFLMTKWIFFTVPAAVVASASAFAGDAAFCIVLSGQHRAVKSWLDITPLRMLGGHLVPHSVLLIATPDGPIKRHWSYNKRSFVEDRHMEGLDPLHACEPQIRFLDRLAVH